MERDAAVRMLNELFAEEVEAMVRYLHLAATLKGMDRLILQDTLMKGVHETLQHAQEVAEQIVQHGGAPKLDIRIQLPAELTTGPEALRTALEFEEAALEGYRELLSEVEGDVLLEEFARMQVAIESRHVSDLKLLLKE